ncbi:MAG TPA: hypothetical protein VIM33_08855 [Gaiellaceae bacterium]
MRLDAVEELAEVAAEERAVSLLVTLANRLGRTDWMLNRVNNAGRDVLQRMNDVAAEMAEEVAA